MAEEVVQNPNEIYLSSTRFPIRGEIRPYLLSVWPGKVVFGDYSKDTEQIASNWVISDQRGGIGVEEMDEAVHQDRCWWSTCQLGHRGHIPLPPLATQMTLPTVTTASNPTNNGMEAGTLGSEAIDESYITDDDGADTSLWDGYWRAQTFTPKADITLTKVSLKMYREGSPGTITVSIRATTSDVPSGNDLSTAGTTDGDTLTTETAGEWRDINIADVALTGNTKYAIVVRVGGDSNNKGNWRYDASSPTYSYGARCTSDDSGVGWTESTSEDFMFKVYGTWYTVNSWTGGRRCTAVAIAGSYSLVCRSETSYQEIKSGGAFLAEWKSRCFGVTAVINTGTASNGKISIYDGKTTTDSDYHTGGGEDETITVRKQLASDATCLRIICDSDTANVAYFDTITIEQPTTGSPVTFCNFNNSTYLAEGNILAKFNETAGTSFDYLYSFPATITDLIVSEGNNLYIFLGDDDYYYYMDSDEAFTATTNAAGKNANYGVHWNAMLFKVNTAGQLAYSADPSSATPSFTNNGLLPLSSSDCHGLELYRDADQNEIIYAATKQGWWAHDYTNAKWLQTLVRLPSHSYAGKGFVNWHDAAYISNGLEVKKYVTGATATISNVGLNRDDGLPTEYVGEIVWLIRGNHHMYALVDSSLVTGTGYSGVYQFDGMNWECKWLGSTADDTMHCGTEASVTVSSATEYRVFFDHDDKVYSIPLDRTDRNPVKVSTSTFDTAGVHITPWFDAATAHDKLALRLNVDCDGMSANETVTVYYRINHATTAIAATWTALGSAITSDGETSLSFGTAGIEFRSIQFKFALARGGTSTNRPDILKSNLVYLKVLDTKWGWQCQIDCSNEYGSLSPAQLVAALKTIIETKTLSEFTYRNESGGTETHYVRVAWADATEPTGDDWRSAYWVKLIAP